MMGLPGIVVNPFSSGLRIVCNALVGDRVYGLVDGNTYVIDLVAGAVYQTPIGGQMVWCYGDYLDEEVHIPAMPEGTSTWLPEYQQKMDAHKRAVKKARKKMEVMISPFAVGVLTTITAGRVSAEDLMKGLKARGVKSPCKVRNNYAGGWDFFVRADDDSEIYWTVESFIAKCFPQRVDSDHS